MKMIMDENPVGKTTEKIPIEVGRCDKKWRH
jgi:hypothetical protein